MQLLALLDKGAIMALFKRGNVWWMEVTAPGGKKLRESTKATDRLVAEKVQEVRRLELALNAEKYRQEAIAQNGKTWKEACDRWLSEHDSKRSAKDDRRYGDWWTAKLGNTRLADVKADSLRKLLEGKRREASGSTANRHLSFMSAVLNAALKEYGWIASKPHLRRYQEPRGVVRYLTASEIDRLLAELPLHQRNMAVFALATGARQGAVKRLRWSAVNLEQGFCWIVAEDSKSGEPICVPLNKTAHDVLAQCKGNHNDFVFTYKGKPVEQVNSAAWRKAVKRAGLSNFRWHDLRHTWASHHAMNGTPAHVLQDMGGWHDASMVKRYAHLSPESLKAYVGNAAR